MAAAAFSAAATVLGVVYAGIVSVRAAISIVAAAAIALRAASATAVSLVAAAI